MNLRKKLPQSLKTSQNKQHQCKKQATIQHTYMILPVQFL